MARLATWRALPDEPRTFLGWLLADERPRGITPMWAVLLIAAVLFIVLGWTSLLTAYTWASFSPLALVPLIALNVRSRSRPRDLNAYITLPSPGPAFACRIEVHTDANRLGEGLLLGSDEGVLTFVDGWLHYIGGRTEFALRRPEVRKVDPDGMRQVVFLSEGRAIVVDILDERDADHCGRAFRVWWNSLPTPKGEPILPPTGVHPVGLARAWRDVFGTLALLMVLSVGQIGLWEQFPLVAIGFWGGGSFAAFRRLAAVRRLNRREGVSLPKTPVRPKRGLRKSNHSNPSIGP